MARKKTCTLAFKAAPEVELRVDAASRLLGISKSALFLAAVDAVLAAIERDKGIVLPVEFRFHPARRPTPTPTPVMQSSIQRGGPISEEEFHHLSKDMKSMAENKRGGH